MSEPPRGIAVVDLGSTNTKVLLFDAELELLGEAVMPSVKREGPPYLAIDLEPALDFVAEELARLDRVRPVDVVVPCAHGSSLALLDRDGALALPIMDYTAQPPEAMRAAYAEIEPPFAEVFAPTNPGALTLGLQLLWQERAWPEAFARVETILPMGQYLALRLGGQAVSEVTAWGAQTHLWDVAEQRPSSLARARGWAPRFAPLAQAWGRVGRLAPRYRGAGCRGQGEICVGIHDSSANYLRYARSVAGRFALLSTGTWIIGFDGGADIARLDPRRDVVTNCTVQGAPVTACRFKGGEEYALLAADVPGCGVEALADLIAAGTRAWPSFTDSGGPVPGTGGAGRIVGPDPGRARGGLAALYCAQMCVLSLEAMSGAVPARVIVDGPFGQNADFLGALAALLPAASVQASDLANGTAAGAALLALADAAGRMPSRAMTLREVAAYDLPGLAAYDARWRTEVAAR